MKRHPASPDSGDAAEQAVQEALAGFAHEVRTPLNGILVLAELLAAADLPARERGWAATLKGAAEHLASLTTVVVDGARAGRGALEPRREGFDPTALAAALADGLAARASAKGLCAETRIAEGLPRAAAGDPVLIRAAVENLIDNAVKFTERGTVSLAVDAVPDAGGLRLCFTVADHGIGMAPDEVAALFRPFRQANAQVARRYGGAGLGLAFARQVARAMGGDVTVESRPGAGSTFRFAARVAPADAAPLVPAATAPAKTGLRILCAEDNPFGRAILKALVEPLGHRIDCVGSGDAAVAAVAAGGYDAVLMDVTLPGLDGIEATRRIRALAGAAGRTPVIGVSGRGAPAEEAAARAAGMDGYLVKPVTAARLADAFRALAAAG